MPIDDQLCHNSPSPDQAQKLDTTNGSDETAESPPSVVSGKRKKDITNGSDETLESPSLVSGKRKKAVDMNHTQIRKELEYATENNKNDSESERVSLDTTNGSDETLESPPSVVSGKTKKPELVDLVKPEDFSWAQILKEFEYFDEDIKLNMHDKYHRFNLGPMNRLVSGGRKPHEETDEEHGRNWFYRDHWGYMRGPLSRNKLKRFVEAGIFPRNTMVLRDGQKPNQAISLTDMLRTDEGDAMLLGTRKKTDEGDGAAESDISAPPKMPPPEEKRAAASNVIPWELKVMIWEALKLRDCVMESKRKLEAYSESDLDSADMISTESDYYYSNLELEQCEAKIRNLVKRFKELKQLPRDWEYDPATASSFVAAESDISALQKMPPPKEKPSNVIPWELYVLIEVALELRETMSDCDYEYLRVQLKQQENSIRSFAKKCKKEKILSRDWKYNPYIAASTYVIDKPDISALKHMQPPRRETVRCCSFVSNRNQKYRNQKFPKTKDVPLDEEEKIIWRDFREFDKNHVGLKQLDLNTVDEHKRPLLVDNTIVSLISKFAVTAFNEAIEMYVKKGEQNNIHDFDVVECKYLKMKDSSYYFYITIDAFEERKRGIYDAKVRLKWHDGSKSLLQFVLTDREPPDDEKTMKLEKRKTHPDSWPDVTDIPFSGMRPRRNRKGICRGYDYQDMGHAGP